MGENQPESNNLAQITQIMETLLDKKNQDLERTINGNTDRQIASLSNKIAKIAKDNETISLNVKDHEERLTNVEKRNKIQESIEKNSNIVMYGIQGINYNDTLNKILDVLKYLTPEVTKYQIKEIIKLSKGGWNEGGPVKVILVSNILKNDIMKSKFKLQGRDIRIAEDISEENRKIRQKLAPYSLAERNKGNKVFMRKDTLVINGKPWTLSELENRDKESMDTEELVEITKVQNTTSNIGMKRPHNLVTSTPPPPPKKLNNPLSAKRIKTSNKQESAKSNLLQQNLSQLWGSVQNLAEESSSSKNTAPPPVEPVDGTD